VGELRARADSGRGVGLVVEAIGPDTLEQSLAAASLCGQIVLLITRDGKSSRIEIAGTACAAASPGFGVCL